MTVAATRHAEDITVENLGAVPSMRALLARLLPLCGPETDPPTSMRSWCPPPTCSTVWPRWSGASTPPRSRWGDWA